MISRFTGNLCLLFLTGALAFGVLQSGGDNLTDWNVCLLVIALTALVYGLRRPDSESAHSAEPVLGWAILLFPAYVALQIIPLPRFALRLVSPVREKMLENLGPLMKLPVLAPISILSETTFEHLFRILGYTLVFLIIRDIARRSTREQSWTTAIPLVWIGAAEGALGFYQSLSGVEVQGTYSSRDHFTGLLEMILPIAVAYGISLAKSDASQDRSRTLYTLKACGVFAMASLILAAIAGSFSRGGFVAGLGGLLFMGSLAMWDVGRLWRKWAALAFLGIVFLLVFAFLPPNELVERFTPLFAKSITVQEDRIPIWRDTLRVIGEYPLFGSGLGTFETAILKYQTAEVNYDYTFAHNDYLELTSELGLVGIVILAALMLPIFYRTVRAATRAREPNTRYLGLGCSGAMVAIFIHSMTDFNMYIPANAFALAWISGIASSLSLQSASVTSKRTIHAGRFATKAFMALGCLLLVYVTAWMIFQNFFRSDSRAEKWFCHFGICDTEAVITAQSLEHGNVISAVPAVELLQALRRDAATPGRWCDLGEAMFRSGFVEKARYCFSNALALGPNVPPIKMRAADFYYDVLDHSRVLQQEAQILDKTDAYDRQIFDWFSRKKLAVSEILAEGMPHAPRASQSYLRYLMSYRNKSDAEAVWNWMLFHQNLDDPIVSEYLNFLFSDGRYAAAQHAWAIYLGDRSNGYLKSNLLFNGGFETKPSGSVYDWIIESPNSPGVQTDIDSTLPHSGKQSLRIRFAGKENVNYGHVHQAAFLSPGEYRFESYIRTQDITTDQGIAFHIYDRENSSILDVRTESVRGTHDWMKVELVFRVPVNPRLLEFQIVRNPSGKFDNKIGGVAWVDSISLVKLNATHTEPEKEID